MTLNSVKVSKASLLMCLKCPLCSNLVHEATTISECLHTFCRDCIHQELDEEENDCCPICNVHLGCSPLEKLRPDRQLDDVCAKIFPSKPKKRKVVDEDVDINAPAPAKRKERSLSSLGIGVPPAANPGFVKRKTKSVNRRSSVVTSRESSTDIDSEGKQSDTAKSGVDVESETNVKGCAQEISNAALSKTEETDSLAKKEDTCDHDPDTSEAKLVRKLEQLSSCKKMIPVKKEPLTAKNVSITGKGEINSVFETLRASAIGARKLTGTAALDQPNLVDEENFDIEQRKIPASFTVVRERSAKGGKKRSALAKLAEIAVDQAVKERDPHMFHVPRAPRGRGPIENAKASETAEQVTEYHQEKIQSTTAAQVLLAKPPQPSFKSLPTTDKIPSIEHVTCLERWPIQDTASTLPLSKQRDRNAGFWFVLQSAENNLCRTGGCALPHLSARYLRVKDGKLPVSIVKKYLVKKLHLTSEHEVEITCRGQPVVPNLPLESIRSIWFATMPPSVSKREGCTLVDDLLMVLTYGRSNRLPT